jgi:uncharacterized protein (TIGR01568 family)
MSKELEITKPPPQQISLSPSVSFSKFYMEKSRKSFKDRLSKFLLRTACSNTTTSATPFRRLPRIPQSDLKPSPNTTRKLERHLSFPSRSDRPVIQITIDCAGRHSVDAAPPSVKYKKKNERRLTETGFSYLAGDREGRKCPPASPYSPSNCVKHQFLSKSERKDKEIGNKLFYKGYTVSSSSSVGSEDDNEPEFFSSDREKQELISSRSFSFSSESSEFYQHKNKFARQNRFGKAGIEEVEVEEENGFAVVKRSVNPYKDFRNSMVEMILQRRIKGADDMRRLLESYLELNSPEHHPTIVSAFADVWDAIFPKS